MKNNKKKDELITLKDCYQKYIVGNYHFTVRVDNDCMAELLNFGAPMKLTMPNEKSYDARLMFNGIDDETKKWYGVYSIDCFSQKLSYDEFEELYNLINKVEN